MSQEEKKQMALQRIDNLKIAIGEDFVQTQLKSALGESSSAFAASIIDIYTGDTNLQQCDPKLVVMNAMKAAVLKLPINKSLGYAWIVPFNGNPTFQIGYKGLIQLAMRTGEYRHLNADIVYEGEYQSKNKLTGEFSLNGTRKSETVIGYFAYFELRNGFSKTLYMTTAEVTAHAKKYSKSFNGQYSPWKTEFDKMALKTVLRNLLTHWGFLSVEMANAIESDADQDAADKVLNDIRGKANKEEMDLTQVQEGEVVDNFSNNGNQGGGAPF
jgi:recombination protein RecT